MTKPSNKEYYYNNAVKQFNLDVDLRECMPGEQFTDSGK
jgi:hypothetical protein